MDPPTKASAANEINCCINVVQETGNEDDKIRAEEEVTPPPSSPVAHHLPFLPTSSRSSFLVDDHDSIDFTIAPLPTEDPAIPQTENRPGAYSATPGAPVRRVTSLNIAPPLGSTTTTTTTTTTTHHVGTTTPTSSSFLVQATPVDEEAPKEMVDARPIDPQARKQNNKQYLAIRVGLLLIAIASIFLGVFFGIQNMKRTSEQQQNQPTNAPTTSPSLAPTMAPSNVMDDLLTILPNYTLASLNDYDFPQSKAFSWLSYHQNITNLPAWRKEQLFALSTFYYAMEGPHWPSYASKRWLDDSVSECLWFSSLTGYVLDGKWIELENLNDVEDYYGSHQCNLQGEIHTIHLSQLGLGNYTPFVPPEIGLLSSLEKIFLGKNDIGSRVEDMLPSQLSQLQHLLYIDLSSNALTGTIPTTIGLLTNLQLIALSINSITGTLPSEIGLMKNVSTFHCMNNNVHGSIPTAFGLMTNMSHLALIGNDMTGAVPSELGLLRGMEYFYVSENQFSSTLPSELGLWTGIKQFWMSKNSLTGALPTEIGLWSTLGYLWLEENYFSGQIPSHLGRNITDIKLNGNSLTGDIPSQWGQLEFLEFLCLSNNSLSGTLPSELGLLTNLWELHLSHNPFLTGTIPEEIGTLVTSHTLGVVDLLGSTKVKGQIPEEICFLQSPNCTYQTWAWMTPSPCSLEFTCAGDGNRNEGLLCGCDCHCTDP